MEPIKPTKEQEAIQLLDRAVATVNTDRAGHVSIQNAIRTLVEFVNANTPTPMPAEEPHA